MSKSPGKARDSRSNAFSNEESQEFAFLRARKNNKVLIALALVMLAVMIFLIFTFTYFIKFIFEALSG